MAKKTIEELEKIAATPATPAKPKPAKAKAKKAKPAAKKPAPKLAKAPKAKVYEKINYKVAKAPKAGYTCACGCGASCAKLFARGHVSRLLKIGRVTAHKAIDRAYDRIEKR